jgi:hypothetical protein
MKTKIYLTMAVIVLLSSSCQKSLLNPNSQISVSNQGGAPFATAGRIYSQVLGLYANLKSGQLYGGRYEVYNEIKAENFINATSNSVTGYQTWTESVSSTSSEVLNLWSQAYYTINNCNLFIDGMAAGGSAVVGTALSANYVAEAKFVRALTYYALLQMYCQPYSNGSGSQPGVPLRLTGLSSYDIYDQAPATVAQVYAQVIADLNAAETDLPAAYYTSGTTLDPASNTTRAHKNSAIAFKTRVYLSMQQYSSVITEANKIVPATAPFIAPTGVPNALQADITKVFASPYTTTESIFSVPFSTTETPGTQNQMAYYFYNNGKVGSAEYYLNAAGVISDPTWKATDKRRSLIYTAASGNSYVAKWTSPTPYPDWVPVIRYSEVLLNLAEARARTNATPDPQAIALLNAVRGRSDASTVFTAASFPAGVSSLISAILEERNIEFLGEGLRWSDLLRLGLPIPAKGGIVAVNPTDPTYIWPMSGNEQLYNKLIGR